MKATRRIMTALTVMAMTILPATSHAQGYYYDDDDWHETEMPVRRTNGIMILGKGSEMRYMSCYGGCPDNGEAYAQTANTYKKTFGRNVNVYLMPIPLAVEFYCPPTAYEWSREQLPVMMHMFDCLEGVKAVDIYPTLSEHSDERIYSRTDHHWMSFTTLWEQCRSSLRTTPFAVSPKTLCITFREACASPQHILTTRSTVHARTSLEKRNLWFTISS